jgi:Ca-activated chloride channel family protein
MTFAEPIWLVAGLVVCLALLWLYHRFDRRQRAALTTFASSHLLGQLTASFSPGRRTLKRVLYLAGVACIFIALARPQWGFRWQEVHRKGIDILFAVDTSRSMLAQDVKPNRITRAKLAVTDLVNKLDGDRVGLIAFAGDAFLQAPLTLDYDAFKQALDAVDVGIVPRGGTNVASAIQEAELAFGADSKNEKILVLITDGEDLEAKGVDAAKAAAKDGLKVYTIGVGGTAGELIPVPDQNGGTTFLKDESDQYVKSHLDESTLQQIARATGALYAPLGQQGQGLETVYQHALAPLAKHDLMSRMEKVPLERFQWPLAAGCALLLVELFIGTRKSRFGRRKFAPLPARRTRVGLRPAAVALVLAMLGLAVDAQASPQAAESAYKKGDFATAESQYQQAAAKDPQAPALQFNLGAAAYKSGQYDKALPAFQKTLGTDKLDVQQQAYYNLGNTQYRVGQKAQQAQPEEAIKDWKGALASYDGALKLNPADTDAKFNRDFVQKKLDELQKQQQQKKDQQKQQDKDQQSKDQQSKDQQSKDQQSKDQQSKDQQSKDQQSKDQQSKDQQGNEQKDQPPGSQPKDQPDAKQNQAPQPDKDQNGQDKQQTQLAKKDQKPQPTPGETQPEPSPQPTPGQPEQESQGQPGEMTPQEAKSLLDSVKNDEHVLPTAPDARANNQETQPTKDW